MSAGLIAPDLIGTGLRPGSVPETMLVSLWGRAAGARRRPPLLADPLAVALTDRLALDFQARFGAASVAAAVRAAWCDERLRRFLARHPGGAAVAALGEGLETQFWRVDDGRVRWLTVDLPEAIALRRRALPAHPRADLAACSALDPAWLAALPPGLPVFVTACGLLMYLQPAEVVALLRCVAARCRGGELVFDTVPPWVGRRSRTGMRLPDGGVRPAMPFSLPLADVVAYCRDIGGLRLLEAATYGEAARGGLPVSRLLSRWRRFRAQLSPGLVHAALA